MYLIGRHRAPHNHHFTQVANLPDQIAQGFVCFVGNPTGGQISREMAARQLLSVVPLRLDPVARDLRLAWVRRPTPRLVLTGGELAWCLRVEIDLAHGVRSL